MSRARTSPSKNASAGSLSSPASVLGLILVTFLLSRLKPAVPSVDRSTVWIDTVKRGPMVRQVRGLGTLVPVDIRWIAANTEGRVEKIVVWPGTHSASRHGYFGIDQPGARTNGRRRGIESEGGGSRADHLARDASARAARPGIDYGAGSFRVRTGQDGAADQRSTGQERPRFRFGLQDIEGEGGGARQPGRDRKQAPRIFTRLD